MKQILNWFSFLYSEVWNRCVTDHPGFISINLIVVSLKYRYEIFLYKKLKRSAESDTGKLM